MARRPKPAETKPISIRLTEQEREQLASEAGKMPVGSYVRRRLFGKDGRTRAIRVPAPTDIQLARLLAQLGQSDIAANLRELAEAARVGALPATPETEHAIRSACDAVERMRADLLQALGLRRGTYE